MEHLDWLLRQLTLEEIYYLYTHPYNGMVPSITPSQPTQPILPDSQPGSQIQSSIKEPKQITNTGNATVEYASVCPFNSENTAILVLYNDVFGLHDAFGSFYKLLPNKIHAMSEPRWDRKNPNLFYFIDNNKLCSFDISKDWNGPLATRVLCEFKGRISGKGESDISLDGRYLVLVEDERQIIKYNLITNRPESYFYWEAANIESLYLTPSNSVLVSTSNGVYEVKNGFVQQICNNDPHKDIMQYNNEDYVIWTNSNDTVPLEGCPNGIEKINLNKLNIKKSIKDCLLSLDWDLAVNISTSDNGIILISTYAPKDTIQGEIIKLDLNGNHKVICKHKSKPFNTYNWEPRASISRDGTRFVFNSNYGKNPGSNYSEVYLMDLV